MRDWDGERVTEVIYLRVQLKPFQWEFTTAPLPPSKVSPSVAQSYQDFLAMERERETENQQALMLYTKHGLDSPWIRRGNYGMTLQFGKSGFILKGDKQQRPWFPELFRPTSTSAQVIEMLTTLYPAAELHTKCDDCGEVDIAVSRVQTCIRCGHEKPKVQSHKRVRSEEEEEKEEKE